MTVDIFSQSEGLSSRKTPASSGGSRHAKMKTAIMQAMKGDKEQARSATGIDAVIEAYKRDTDVTLIRENLRLTVDQRFQQLQKLQEFAEELRRAGRKANSRK